MSEEDLSSVFCLPNGEQLYLHSDTPSVGDWPVTLSQVFLLQDGHLLLSNGMLVNPLEGLNKEECEALSLLPTNTDLEQDEEETSEDLLEGEIETLDCTTTTSLVLSQPINEDTIPVNISLRSLNVDPNIIGIDSTSNIVALEPAQELIEDLDVELNSNDNILEADIVSDKDCDKTVDDDEISSLVDVVTTFKCRKCNHTAESRQHLLEHISLEHVPPKVTSPTPAGSEDDEDDVAEKLVFLCAQCAEAFDSLESCRQHMLDDHRLVRDENQPVPDPPSPEQQQQQPEEVPEEQRARRITRLPKNLDKDYQVGTKSKNRLRCGVVGCKAKFTTEKDLDMHDLCHNSEQVGFKCCECSKHFDRWKPCAVHLWRDHQVDVGMLSCDTCGYKTTTPMKLATHMRIHSDARDFKCNTCGKCFKQLSQLKNHRMIHADKNGHPHRWYTSKECHICHRTYADAKCLKKHVSAVHGRIKPYTCPVCGHTSARKAMMQLHLRQHSGEKPYACDACDFRTGDHNSLRRHKMRHTGVKKYQCPHCSYASIQSSSFKNHLRARHPDKDGDVYECSACGYQCLSAEKFKAHVADHEREEQQRSKRHADSDLFPGNLAAANLIFRCLQNDRDVRANIASKQTSADGSEQTITIQIPADSSDVDDGCIRVEDLVAQRHVEEQPDLGGITIPADPDPPLEQMIP